mmetsp:Transcript_70782/g.110787  ORF Transcript_70782/g.110787 Transcript_70782/m.110787 type:complete len:131 (-) Transcript_70782:2309-2701(-)
MRAIHVLALVALSSARLLQGMRRSSKDVVDTSPRSLAAFLLAARLHHLASMTSREDISSACMKVDILENELASSTQQHIANCTAAQGEELVATKPRAARRQNLHSGRSKPTSRNYLRKSTRQATRNASVN